MTKAAELIKLSIATYLESQGSNLEEFEKSLAQVNTAEGAVKVAGVLDGMKDFTSILNPFASAVPPSLEMLAASALLTGSLGGATLYGADRHLQEQDKRLGERQTEVDRMKSLTDRLKTDYGIK